MTYHQFILFIALGLSQVSGPLRAEPEVDLNEGSPSVELVRPESYAIRRFEEVLEAALEDLPKNTQERLIRERALLTIAQRQKEDLVSTRRVEPTSSTLRAIEARIDHHEKQVKLLEEEARKRR